MCVVTANGQSSALVIRTVTAPLGSGSSQTNTVVLTNSAGDQPAYASISIDDMIFRIAKMDVTEMKVLLRTRISMPCRGTSARSFTIWEESSRSPHPRSSTRA